MVDSREVRLARAATLEAEAGVNDCYRQKFEETGEKNGYPNFSQISAHRLAAARKRESAARLRAE